MDMYKEISDIMNKRTKINFNKLSFISHRCKLINLIAAKIPIPFVVASVAILLIYWAFVEHH